MSAVGAHGVDRGSIGAPGLDLTHPQQPQEPVWPRAETLAPRAQGRPRKFWVCVFLGIVTLGIYFWYWQLRVFGEVDRQENTRRWAGLWWASMVLCLAAFLLLLQVAQGTNPASVADMLAPELVAASMLSDLVFLAYIGLEARNLRSAGLRRGLAMPPVVLVLAFLGIAGLLQAAALWGGPSGLYWIGLPFDLLGYGILQDGLNKYWKAVYPELGQPLPPAPMSTW